MSSWLERQGSSHQTQLIATAIVSGITVLGVVLGVQAIKRQVAVDDLKASIPNVDEAHDADTVPNFGTNSIQPLFSRDDERAAALARRAQHGDYDEELIQEQLTRTASFLKPEGLSALRSSFVVVIGLGGVGSHCTAALARSGVSHIRIIDFDQVTLSSLNRNAVATLADVGIPKVTCVRKRLEAVTPWVHWECLNEMWREDHGHRLLASWGGEAARQPDYVVDAIDNIDSKVTLLKYCHEHGIRVISSMGAGCKSDPTRVYVGDISGSIEDPLSRTTRRRLRILGISEGIPVAYSIEKAGPGKAELLPLSEEEFQKGGIGELSVLPDFRARILPVLGTMPAVFGYVIANFVIMELSGYPHESGGRTGREKLYESVLQGLQAVEVKLARAEGVNVQGLRIPVSKDDVSYLIEEIFRGKSVVSGLPTRLALIRWRPPKDAYQPDVRWEGQKFSRFRLSDLVCMTKEEAADHEKKVLADGAQPEDIYEAEVVALVERRLNEEQAMDRYR
ncbi:hypothetical protein MMC34_001954 [Xylographa carneopallida]|nr:hypothetical protein [Xylographa carneopallida]